VAEDYYQPRVVTGGGEFDTADLGGSNDVAGYPNDEQVSQALIEDQLRRNPRIGASEDDREGPLSRCQGNASGLTQERVRATLV
jgi:hypothetical protein